jgi:hypothetical protein
MRRIGNPNELPSGGTPEPGAFTKPRQCAVLPNRTTDPEGFIATGHVNPSTGEEVIVSFAGARELGRFVGMPDEKDLNDLTDWASDQIEEQGLKIASLEAEVAHLRKIQDARELVAAADQKEAA